MSIYANVSNRLICFFFRVILYQKSRHFMLHQINSNGSIKILCEFCDNYRYETAENYVIVEKLSIQLNQMKLYSAFIRFNTIFICYDCNVVDLFMYTNTKYRQTHKI